MNDLAPGTKYQWFIQSKCDTNIIPLSTGSKVKKFETLPLRIENGVDIAVTCKVYPNPVNEWLTVSGLQEANVSLTIIDAAGCQVNAPVQNSDQQYQVDIRHLSPGCYFLSITSERFSKIEKVIVF